MIIPVTGVVWFHPWLVEDGPHIEFHIRSSDHPRVGGTGHIQLVVVRVNMLARMERILPQQNLVRVHDLLRQLTSLQEIVLETNEVNATRLGNVLLDVGVSFRRRTCQEAHTLALQSRTQGAPVVTGPLSPFWCLEEYNRIWETW